MFQCAHEFSWPRKSPSGDYYQVCLRCGVEYGYDWTTMQRTDRVQVQGTLSSSDPTQPVRRKPTWRPRARRLSVDTPVQYRLADEHEWRHGVVRNISKSGVLFECPEDLPLETELVLIFEMPQEVSGQQASKVICDARVSRVHPDRKHKGMFSIAVAMDGYQFLHERQSMRAGEWEVIRGSLYRQKVTG